MYNRASTQIIAGYRCYSTTLLYPSHCFDTNIQMQYHHTHWHLNV